MYQPILYAEDDENDVFFMERALDQAAIANPLQLVRNGQEAIDYLTGVGEFAEREKYPLPVLVLLDLKMPRLSGLEVLRTVRARKSLQGVWAVVLVSSRDDRSVKEALALGANGYIVKPPTCESLRKLIQALGERGFHFVSTGTPREAALPQSLPH